MAVRSPLRPSDYPKVTSPLLPTVSRAFVQDWLDTLGSHCSPEQLRSFLGEVDLQHESVPMARVTHDQIVRLYQLVAVETGDEMMGLWSRPIRSGALKHLCTSVRTASSLSAAMYRFVTFWNMVLDDHRLELTDDGTVLRITLSPAAGVAPHRFGHMLLLKLAHGVASWLVGRELPLDEVAFAFEAPDFAEDYPLLFPSPVVFGANRSCVGMASSLGALPVERSAAEMHEFLVRAPRDWIFTSLAGHTLALRVREQLMVGGLDVRLVDAARWLNVSPRTLIRQLAAEGTSFQRIHDGVRRDVAIRELVHSERSIDSIARQVGFSSGTNFHRAFRRWTGATPGSYRTH